ncbi:hypothetical protein Gferi_22910 [Geosporobacter ferrireducens]|uniref:Phosphatidic acid phosphatase type 2/haloperoxidase domain-containing protein n=2 Tax=Geosporobacter ferrireducens TaxID=1424294 RepID=A0A1D8GMI6_9FIRM|nr:hypothetical protein Gferi_22910 [Geosporobacter ferrireducens]
MLGMFAIDERIFKFLFGITGQFQWIGRWMVFITEWSSKVFAVIYLSSIVCVVRQGNTLLIPLVLGPALGLGTVYIIRFFYYRPRPFTRLKVQSLIDHEESSSLPSKHALSAFVIATSVLCIYPVPGYGILLLASITGISRIMVGVHYPLDIIFGAVLGIIIGIGTFSFLA